MLWLKKTLTNFFHNLINSQFHLFLPTHCPFSRENLRKKRKSAGANSKINPITLVNFLRPFTFIISFPFRPFSFAFFIFSLPFPTISYRATTPHWKIFMLSFFQSSDSLSSTRFLSLLRLHNQITASFKILSFRFSDAFSAELKRRNHRSAPFVARSCTFSLT